MSIADALDISPWESLITEVRRSNGRIAWLDARLVEAVAADEQRKREAALADPDSPQAVGLGTGVKELLDASQKERRHCATISKAAIDAGVAERLVRELQNEGVIVATAIVAALDALSFLTLEQRTLAVAAAHAKLLAIEMTPPGTDPFTIDGETA
jgi:hypothetical protein